MRSGFFLLIFFLFCGCITPWRYTSSVKETVNHNRSLSFTAPAKWYTRNINKTILYTRNGLSLESILISRVKWSDTLSNGSLLSPQILLHQIPEVILGEYWARDNAFNLTIFENSIITIGDLPVSKTSYSYTSPNALTKYGEMYCVPFKNQISIICYEAESSCYYPKSVDDFSAMIRSVSIKNNKYQFLLGIHSSADQN